MLIGVFISFFHLLNLNIAAFLKLLICFSCPVDIIHGLYNKLNISYCQLQIIGKIAKAKLPNGGLRFANPPYGTSSGIIAPKGLRNLAQGCGLSATLGHQKTTPINPNGVASGDGMPGLWGNYTTPLGLEIVRGDCPQGSGVAATLGCGTEFRWDSITMSGKIDVAELDIRFPPSMKDAEGVADA